MGIQFTLAYYYLLLNIGIYLLLVIPWPHSLRKVLLHIFTTSTFAQNLHKVQGICLILIIILFADSLRAMSEYQGKHELLEEHEVKEAHHHRGDEIEDQKLHTKIFFAQRNVYLTSFALFVSFALFRLTSLLGDLCRKEEKLQEFEKSGLLSKDKEPKKND